MRVSSLSTILVLATTLLAGCGGGKKSTAPLRGTSDAAPPGSLAASLEAELGRPVAIVPSAEGLLAVSADGARRRVLVPGAIGWALVDNRAGVVWFGPRDAIRLLDLHAASPSPEDIVAELPTEVIEGAPGIVIDYAQGPVELAIGHPAYHRIILSVGAEPSLLGDPGAWTDDEEFGPAVAARPLTPAVKARLVELYRRGEGHPLALPASYDEVGKVPGVDPAECPDDDSLCGQATAIPGTKLWRVITSFACGDGCHPGYKVYDPARKQFVDSPPAELVQMAWMTPDARAIVRDGAITRLDGKGTVLPASEGVEGGGWLGASYYLPF